MQPSSSVRSLDDSLYESQKVLCEMIEEIVSAIHGRLTGVVNDETAGGYGLGGVLAVADQNTQRLTVLAGPRRVIGFAGEEIRIGDIVTVSDDGEVRRAVAGVDFLS